MSYYKYNIDFFERIRGIVWTPQNIYDGAYPRKYLTAENRKPYFPKNLHLGHLQVTQYASAYFTV